MCGPVNKPLPLSDDEYARREEARYASLEAPEVVAEFIPAPMAEERCERDVDYMLAHENFQLYSEWGIVR